MPYGLSGAGDVRLPTLAAAGCLIVCAALAELDEAERAASTWRSWASRNS
jgi:hypothetical protein